MIRINHLRKNALGNLCRDCINRKYSIKLKRRDCIYGTYPYPCRECNDMRHIVVNITFRARWKLLFGTLCNDK